MELYCKLVRTNQNCGYFPDVCRSWRICGPTLQHDEAHRPVQVDVLVLPLQEGHPAGEAAQDVIDNLRPRPAHRCGEQSQRRGQPEPRCPHLQAADTR